jgi:hypothetical protein
MRYQITVNLTAPMVTYLFNNNYSLCVLKGVTSSVAGVPLIWFSTTSYQQSTAIVWDDELQVYISSSAINAGSQIEMAATCPVPFDASVLIDDGKLFASGGGADGVNIVNGDSRVWTTGLCQSVDGSPNPICATVLSADAYCGLSPASCVALMFVQKMASVGTVVTNAPVPSVLVTMNGVPASVTFDVTDNWIWDSGTTAQAIDDGTDLCGPLVQVPPD